MSRNKLVLPGKIGKYAHGLLDYSIASKVDLREVVEDLNLFAYANQQNDEIREKLARPVLFFDMDKKERVLDKLFPRIGLTTEVAKDFIKLLVEEEAQKDFKFIQADFEALVADELQEVNGVITSAEPLDESQVQSISERMNDFVPEGWTLQVETKVDPTLIGGFTITIGDEFQDLSVATQISNLEEHLASTASQ